MTEVVILLALCMWFCCGTCDFVSAVLNGIDYWGVYDE